VILTALGAAAALAFGAPPAVRIPEGSYVPFIANRDPRDKAKTALERRPVQVAAFRMDAHPVTVEQFRGFVAAAPEWRRSRVPRVFADSNYLASWKGDLKPGTKRGGPRSAVTEVSWFAAQAYCEAQGKRLPTVDEWEYAAFDAGRDAEARTARILAWYAKPTGAVIPDVGRGKPNGYGLHDLTDLVWEWTLDFNAVMTGEEARQGDNPDRGLFCGAGALGGLDATDYASYLRYAFRASLRGAYTTRNLGFRCAKEDGP
jgi:formylglycine-generating enzyme required for sulfatase activity